MDGCISKPINMEELRACAGNELYWQNLRSDKMKEAVMSEKMAGLKANR